MTLKVHSKVRSRDVQGTLNVLSESLRHVKGAINVLNILRYVKGTLNAL